MKSITACILFISMSLMAMADIPPAPQNAFGVEPTDTNYLPLVLGILFAIGILVFMQVLKKESNK